MSKRFTRRLAKRLAVEPKAFKLNNRWTWSPIVKDPYTDKYNVIVSYSTREIGMRMVVTPDYLYDLSFKEACKVVRI